MNARPPLSTLSISSMLGKISKNLAGPRWCRASEDSSISNRWAMELEMDSAAPSITVMTSAWARSSSRWEMPAERSRIRRGLGSATSLPGLDRTGESEEPPSAPSTMSSSSPPSDANDSFQSCDQTPDHAYWCQWLFQMDSNPKLSFHCEINV